MNAMPAMKERHNRLVYSAALALLNKNISVLPCRGKEPAVLNWKPLCQQRATPALVTQWYEAGLLQNVGVIGGAVSASSFFALPSRRPGGRIAIRSC